MIQLSLLVEDCYDKPGNDSAAVAMFTTWGRLWGTTSLKTQPFRQLRDLNMRVPGIRRKLALRPWKASRGLGYNLLRFWSD